MRSLLFAICLLLTLDRTTFVSAITFGYDCSNEFFSNSELKEAAEQARNVPRLGDPSFKKYKKLLKWYDGPPFTKPYLVWPISHKTKYSKRAPSTPYKVVLDENFEVFSMIMENGNNVRECSMREEFPDRRNNHNYRCDEKSFKNEELRIAAKVACPQIQDGSLRRFPARYDGPYKGHFLTLRARQLYLFPLLKSGIYENDNDPGFIFLLFNSKCQIESVLKKKSSGYERCIDIM